MGPDWMETRENLSLLLRSKGFRITPQREKILDLFYHLPEGEHLSAEDVHSQLKTDTTSDISLATAYRTLKLLASLGVLREHAFGEDHRHFELVREHAGPEHQHMICVVCGATEEFTSIEVFENACAVAESLNFDLIEVELKLFGRCNTCRRPSN